MKLKVADTPARTPPRQCPQCNYLVDAASAVNQIGAYQTPTAGDLTVCINCGVPLVFRDDLSLRLLTDAEIDLLSSEEAETVYRVMSATEELLRQKRSR
jgi:hypothetical protein